MSVSIAFLFHYQYFHSHYYYYLCLHYTWKLISAMLSFCLMSLNYHMNIFYLIQASISHLMF